VLEVEKEPVPGGPTEALTGDSHVSIGLRVDVVTDFLEACDATLAGAGCCFVDWVGLIKFLGLLDGVDQDHVNQLDQCDDQRAEGQ
jgi:hypothetical protein